MNNTAVSANGQNAQVQGTNHMIFIDEEHERFFYEKLPQARYPDCYHQALIYALGISRDTRAHFSQIYDIETGEVKRNCLRQGWQTSGSLKVVRLALNLYTNATPTVDNQKSKEDKIRECREYSVEEIFCCEYAPFFWEAVKLRYPEYAKPPRPIEQILAEMRLKRAENKVDGNENRY